MVAALLRLPLTVAPAVAVRQHAISRNNQLAVAQTIAQQIRMPPLMVAEPVMVALPLRVKLPPVWRKLLLIVPPKFMRP